VTDPEMAGQQTDDAVDGKGRSGDDCSMPSRMSALEAKWEAVIPTLATKADLSELRAEMHKGFSDMVKWIVGTAFVGGACAITIVTFVLNNATPRATMAQLGQPTIIFLPANGMSVYAPSPSPPSSGATNSGAGR